MGIEACGVDSYPLHECQPGLIERFGGPKPPSNQSGFFAWGYRPVVLNQYNRPCLDVEPMNPDLWSFPAVSDVLHFVLEAGAGLSFIWASPQIVETSTMRRNHGRDTTTVRP